MAPMTLPPGFRFHPTDEELVAYYLHRKINGGVIELEVIPEVDLYKCEPWDLPDKSFLPSKDMEWYFYSPRDRKYPNGSRTNRATRAGYWKATGKDRAVQSEKRPVGMKKTLVYYRGRAPHGIRTDWVMHEYRLIQSAPGAESPLLDSYALCRVFKKNIIIPKTKETVLETSTFDQLLRDDVASAETSREDDALLYDKNINKNRELFHSKLPSDASSSDITQTTTTTPITKDDSLPHIMSDEVNSSIDQFYCLGAENMSNFIQDVRIPSNYTGIYYETPACPPPLAMEDFPQIDLTTAKSISEYMNCDRFRECINGITTLEEIYSIYSSSHLNF